MPELTDLYKKVPAVVSMEIGTGTIVVPIRQNAGDLDCVYTLNETAARIWQLVDGRRSIAQIRDVLVEEYEVGEHEAGEDVSDLVAQWVAIGALEKVNGGVPAHP